MASRHLVPASYHVKAARVATVVDVGLLVTDLAADRAAASRGGRWAGRQAGATGDGRWAAGRRGKRGRAGRRGARQGDGPGGRADAHDAGDQGPAIGSGCGVAEAAVNRSNASSPAIASRLWLTLQQRPSRKRPYPYRLVGCQRGNRRRRRHEHG